MLESLDYIPTPWGNAAKYEESGSGSVTLDSPNFIGIPTASTAVPGTNTTQIATTEFVTYAITLTGAALNDHINLTSAHGATSSNTASRIVLRDGNGNFSAGTITANLTGVASEAIKLQTARTINGVPFDGTADITILGETETTAYRGDRGKEAYDHISLTSVHGATSSNTASRIVLRDGSGNFAAGTITASLFIGQLGNRTTWNSSTAAVNSVIGQLTWRHYGNSHTIIDISNGATPDGTSHNNTNAENGWIATYPTLVGWNGSGTYGLRVDSARKADTVAWSGVSSKPNLWSGEFTNGYWGLVTPAGSASDYVRAPVSGIIPYAPGGSGYLGTPGWPFNYIYGTNIYGNLNGNATTATNATLLDGLQGSAYAKVNTATTWNVTDLPVGSHVMASTGYSGSYNINSARTVYVKEGQYYLDSNYSNRQMSGTWRVCGRMYTSSGQDFYLMRRVA